MLGVYTNDKMEGVMNVAVVNWSTPSFIVSFYIFGEWSAYLHLLNYKSLSPNYVNNLNYDHIITGGSFAS